MLEVAQLAVGGIFTAVSANQYNRLGEGDLRRLHSPIGPAPAVGRKGGKENLYNKDL
jgi:hypothetical protein